VFDSRHVNEETARQRDVRRDARALFRDRLFRDLDQYFLTFTQQIRDRRLVTLASRLSAITTALIAFITLVTSTRARTWFRRGRRRRSYDLFRLCKLQRLNIVVFTVRLSVNRVVQLSRGRTLRLAPLAWSTSPASTAPRGELTTRLVLNNARF
jgi:hypothetical protein